MKVSTIIQARMGSSRFPGKILSKINNETLLQFLINQLRSCKFIEKLVVATTTKEEDNIIHKLVQNYGLEVFRGNENDVLDRYYNCARIFDFNHILRITADNPLIDPQIVDLVIKHYSKKTYDVVSNCQKRTFPYGTEAEVFSFNALEKAWHIAKYLPEREHVTLFFYNNPNLFKIFNVTNKNDLSKFQWTVDKQEDLDLVRKIVSKINKRPVLMNDILQLFSIEPELIKINKNS